jgi:hypothetical protein
MWWHHDVLAHKGGLGDTPIQQGTPIHTQGWNQPVSHRTDNNQEAHAQLTLWKLASWAWPTECTWPHPWHTISVRQCQGTIPVCLLPAPADDLPRSFSISFMAAPIHQDQYLVALATCPRSDVQLRVLSPFPVNLTVDRVLLGGQCQWVLLLAFTRTCCQSVMLLQRTPSPFGEPYVCDNFLNKCMNWPVALGSPSCVSLARCGWTQQLSARFRGPVQYNKWYFKIIVMECKASFDDNP